MFNEREEGRLCIPFTSDVLRQWKSGPGVFTVHWGDTCRGSASVKWTVIVHPACPEALGSFPLLMFGCLHTSGLSARLDLVSSVEGGGPSKKQGYQMSACYSKKGLM